MCASSEILLLFTTAIMAFLAAFSFSLELESNKRVARVKNCLYSASPLAKEQRLSIEDRLISYLELGGSKEFKSNFLNRVANFFSSSPDLLSELVFAGLSGRVSPSVVVAAQLKIGLLTAVIFGFIGLVFSQELLILGFLFGLFLGFSYPRNVLKKMKEKRSLELEQHLPEMLEILSIGMRSGLSFDRACEIYTANFKTIISREIASAQQLWQSGILSREDALRDVSKGYDSLMFSRTIEGLIRSLKLGSSVSESLMSTATEARSVYKAKREEQVRKAPIKMMIPTGALILPAMLLLILGPVLLELTGGGV